MATSLNFKVKNGLDVGSTLTFNGNLGVGSSPSYGTSGQVLTSQGAGNAPIWSTVSGGVGGGLTSVGLSVPTGMSVSNSPLTADGTLAVTLSSGYDFLNSNSTQTIAGAKTFSGIITANNGIAGATAKNMTVASSYSGSAFNGTRVIMTASVTGAADPTTRPDGTALVAGDIWIDW